MSSLLIIEDDESLRWVRKRLSALPVLREPLCLPVGHAENQLV